MILGIGTDIIQISRIEKVYQKFGNKFLKKNYNSLEIEAFKKIKCSKKQISFLAKRFAGKEAVAKALGVGIGQIAFKDIAITNNDWGAPLATIFSKTLNNFNYSIHISLADDYQAALAYAIVCS